MIGVFRVAIIAIAIQTAADLLTEGIEACLEGLQRVDMSRAVDANRRTVVAAGTSVAAAVTGNLGWVAVAACGASLFSLLIALFTLTHHGGHLLAGFDRAEARSLLRYGRTVALLRPLGVIQRTTDRVIVGIILGPGSVALVEVATQVLNGADAILSATSYAVVPSASWLRARQDEPQLRELFLRGTLYSVLATWIVCAAAAGLAGPFVHIWVGARFSRAPTFIAVALAGEVIAAPCQVGSNLLLGTGRAHKILSAAVLTLAVNLIASVFLVEMVGVVGTFLGTSIANVFLLPTLLRTALQETKTTPRRFFRQSIATIILPAAVIAASGWAVSRLPISPVPMLATGVAACLIAGTIVTMLSPSLRGDMSDVLGALRRRSN